jgi:hypothetical protein
LATILYLDGNSSALTNPKQGKNPRIGELVVINFTAALRFFRFRASFSEKACPGAFTGLAGSRQPPVLS